MKTPPKISLANIPTPLEKISFNGHKFLIKRDDLTGVELSGNKVRKLEYILYDAKKKGTEIVFTCGGDQSNHARATAIAAAKLGMKSKLFLWGDDSKQADGNLFLNKFIGAEFSFLNKNNYDNVNQIMFDESLALQKKGKKVYVIPEGGSSTLGIWGYINFVKELKSQIDTQKIKGIVAAAGSGGTAAGLLTGISLLKLNLKIFAVNVLYGKDLIRTKILNLSKGCILDYRLPCKIDESKLQIIDGYSKEGYKNLNKNKLRLIKKFAMQTGIILDPAYTGKAFTGYYYNFILKNKGMKNIFVHTGGLFGVFGKKEKYLGV